MTQSISESCSIEQQLAALQFSAGLPEAVRSELAGIAYQRRFAVGEFLCREGESTPELFLIATGHAGLDMFVPGRGQVRLLTLGPGEILAWSAVVGNHGATATGVATEAMRTIVFPDTVLRELCEANQFVGFHVMQGLARAISRRLVVTRLQLLDLFEEQPPL